MAGAGRCRTLRSRPWSDIAWRGTAVLPAVQRGVAAGSAQRCRRRGCPQRRAPAGVHQPRPVSKRPDRRCPPAARTWRGTQQVAAEPDTAAVSAVRPGAGRTAGVHRGPGRAPEHHGDTAAAGRRPSMHARRLQQWHRPPPADTARVSEVPRGTAATWRCRPDGWMVAAERVSGRLRTWTQEASAVHRCVRTPRPVSGRRCPPGTLPQSAGVRCYRNRSPARRPLEGCRYRRDAWASWRPSRSPSWRRT
jgi:hypothetical protein